MNSSNIKTFYFCLFFFFLGSSFLCPEPLYSPTWGFQLDLPEGYVYTEGNNIDRYSFDGPNNAKFDIAVYKNSEIKYLTADINKRLGNTGDIAFFDYNNKAAALLELNFMGMTGYGLCLELSEQEETEERAPLMLALAYSPAGMQGMEYFHLSALDSIASSNAEMYIPGPVMNFTYPKKQQINITIAGTDLNALIDIDDVEAAQYLVEREFFVLSSYKSANNWQEAWIRYYRMIYRDSFGRVSDSIYQLLQYFDVNSIEEDEFGERIFAEKALAWVQDFVYERDLNGSDFVNLVSAISEGRGDCDSRAMLWAIILNFADIPAAIMVSAEYSHAMGLVDVEGEGARFESGGINWLVAETTDKIGIGLISQDMSKIESWLGVLFY